MVKITQMQLMVLKESKESKPSRMAMATRIINLMRE